MEPIVKRVTLKAPASKVWEALTEANTLSEWMMITANRDIEPGCEFSFQGEKTEEWNGIIYCKVTEMVKNKRLEFTWNSGLLGAQTLVCFDLVEKDGNTELTLTHSGWENLPEKAEYWREIFTNGWRDRISGRLPRLFENRAVKLIADAAILVNSSILFVKYTDINKYDHQKGWFLPDDLIKHVEHPDNAARRILTEQLGLNNIEPKLSFIESFIGGDKSWHLVFHYAVKIDSKPDIRSLPDIAEVKWFDVKSLPPKKDIAHGGWALHTVEEILNRS
jgi:uncharacterized protein YndB with AHSA1/START domain/ADP-ribose pyrophosphatase YjhB (NUDIX family)